MNTQPKTKPFMVMRLWKFRQMQVAKMTEDVIVVDYIYRLKDTSVVANYKTETGEELAESITVEGKVFDEYTTENKTFYGYMSLWKFLQMQVAK